MCIIGDYKKSSTKAGTRVRTFDLHSNGTLNGAFITCNYAKQNVSNYDPTINNDYGFYAFNTVNALLNEYRWNNVFAIVQQTGKSAIHTHGCRSRHMEICKLFILFDKDILNKDLLNKLTNYCIKHKIPCEICYSKNELKESMTEQLKFYKTVE